MFAKQIGIVLALGIGVVLAVGASSLAAGAAQNGNAANGAGPTGAHRQGALGVSLSDKDGRLSISAIQPISPALRAGIKPGDEIASIDGVAVSNSKQFIAEIIKREPGTKVEFSIRRNGQKQTINVTLSSVETLRAASQERRIRDLQRQLAQLQSQVAKMTGNQGGNSAATQSNGDNGWYYQIEPDDPDQGIHDYGARARDGQ